MKVLRNLAVCLGVSFAFGACASTTVLLANFNTEPLGAPPAATQSTGSVEIAPGSGSISVAAAPTGPTAGDNWLRMEHSTQPAPETVMRARFDTFHGPGRYGLTAALFIPSHTGAVTLDLESFLGGISSSPGFLHLDFMPENNVRINDNDATRFGSFPRDQVFLVSIAVDTTVSPATAKITLIGSGATGSQDLNLPALASQFGAVRVWMGAQWIGPFFIDNLLVTLQD